MLNSIIHCQEEMFNPLLYNLLHGLWKCPIEQYQHLAKAYIAGPTYGKKSVKMLFTAPQAFYDYNVFYDTYSLTTL